MSDKITKHFSWSEFERSSYATRNSIDNSVPKEYKESIRALCENVLEPIREKFGYVRVSSGYRGKQLNTAIGGSKTSQHCKGEAADLQFRNSVKLEDVFEWIKENIDYDQVIFEFGAWVHVSYVGSENRKTSLIAYKENGKTKYKKG